MKIIKTKIKDLLILKTNIYKDKRGFFKEVFRKKIFNKKFIFDCLSYSKKNILRGLHMQLKKPQAKLITVVRGKILDVVVDLRKNSKTFGKSFSIILSEKNCKSLYIPEGFGHAYYSFSDLNIIYYKLSNYYAPKYEDGIVWNDNLFKNNWPTAKPIVSKKDKELKTFQEFKKSYKGL